MKGIIALFALYVVINGTDVMGTLEANEYTISDWQEYTLIPVDESFRGKQHYEIKYDGVNVRHATQQEINAYNQIQEEAKKQRALDILDIKEKHLDKLKEITP